MPVLLRSGACRLGRPNPTSDSFGASEGSLKSLEASGLKSSVHHGCLEAASKLV